MPLNDRHGSAVARITHCVLCALGVSISAGAQQADSARAVVRVAVRQDSVPLAAVIVRVGAMATRTDAAGRATLRISAGRVRLTVVRIGFRPDSVTLALRAAQDTSIVVQLIEQSAALGGVIVSVSRGERLVEDTPLRVEVITEDEVSEKAAMTPGNIAMMLNETTGLRVQATNPSLGSANVRIQGLRGRYSLLLSDGLPLFGGHSGGLGLLQIPPVDLGRVEIIKGSASALYGSSALGGVINLVSRRPTARRIGAALVNQTSQSGTDAVAFFTGPAGAQVGYTLLTGAHRQRQTDLDGDGWTDLPGYDRIVVRPRLFFDDGRGATAFLTAGVTAEDRSGGTLPGRTVSTGLPFAEALRTRRADVGGVARWVIADADDVGGPHLLRGAIVSVRGAAVAQNHRHRFGDVVEADRHRTLFGEASLALPRGAVTYVAGVAYQEDRYRNADVTGFDYTFRVPALFVQTDVDPAPWVSVSGSARVDAHNVYGTFVNPRLSVLLRRPATNAALAGWTTRASAGTGAFGPTPFTEETEATGLTPLRPLNGVVPERARSAALDIGGPIATPLGQVDLNTTVFASRIAHPLIVSDADGVTAGGAARLVLANATQPTQTWGTELLLRMVRPLGDDDAPVLRIAGTYTLLRSTECTPTAVNAMTTCERRDVPLTPRATVGLDAMLEQEGRRRVGVELYYTGRQTLEDNPFRPTSRPYLVVGLLVEQTFRTAVGSARVFVNGENLTNVRQTRFNPMLLPSRGRGGRWSTDAWTEVTGATLNAGVRLSF